ncbi:MAG: YfcC family protein, partial [Sporomusa sp.]
MEQKKKGFQLPHVFALMFILTIVMAILTWIVPAGEFTRVKEGAITKVVAGSYHAVKDNPRGFWDVFHSVVKGWEQSSVMIFMVFFCGAAVEVLEKTGAIRMGLSKVVKNLAGKELYAVAIVMTIMSIGGATGALANPVVALIPMGVMLSRSLGYDEVVGFGMIYLGAYAGFNVGWANVFTVGLAHDIAQLPLFSGMEVRVFFHIISLILTFILVAMYCKKIKADPTKSLTYSPEKALEQQSAAADTTADEQLTWRHVVCLLIVVFGFAAIVYGSIELKWGISHYSVVFLMMSVLSGLFGNLGINGTCQAFVKGCGNMVYAAFIIGMARGISVAMTDGKIIDTFVYYLSLPIAQMGPVLGANMMLLANIIINFFIPSGSGQAVTVMPIMVPLADLTGITRQVATQAFQFGDGFTNCIIPTAGTLMGCL